MQKPYYLFLLLLFPLGFITSFYGFPQVIETPAGSSVHITSFEDGAIVHSKVVIDASFDGDVESISVKINGKEYANYVPYVWNNILESAGTYEIEVEATDKLEATSKATKTVIIPEFEVYTPENFTCTEDIVIHKGQTVRWENGTFNCSIPFVDNGLNMIYFKPVFINVYGNLTLSNVSLSQSKDISIEKEGFLKMENCTVHSLFGLDYGIYMNEKTRFESYGSRFGYVKYFSPNCTIYIDQFSIGIIINGY